MTKTTFEKFPQLEIKGHDCLTNWDNIVAKLSSEIHVLQKAKIVLAVECYHGVDSRQIMEQLQQGLNPDKLYDATTTMHNEETINNWLYPYITEDPVFGYMAPLSLSGFFNDDKIAACQKEIESIASGLIIVVGIGASLIAPAADLLVYADMPRWEIQLRFRANKISNIGIHNEHTDFTYQYKRSFFIDWRVCDRHKKHLMNKWNFILDTTHTPKMIAASALQEALLLLTKRPFRVVPFFDPGPWGGQWLKEVCDLDRDVQNFAWGFDCVPEENSLLLGFGSETFEIPSLNLIFSHPKAVLGEKVHAFFGDEFPIRFDFLDTMEGGNLSLQVHPLLSYIKENFGMSYTQEESYYFLEAAEDAFVYLGLKENIAPPAMMEELKAAQNNDKEFDAEKYVEKWPVKKHDHILIPAGTVHCSGANSVVLEISATPYIFTFKLWDWGRMGLNGKPRPISLKHGERAIQWNRTTNWTEANLINRIELIAAGDGWREEKTGLHEGSFIETHRHWFTKKVDHDTNGVVNVLNLVGGEEIIVESPVGAFAPYVIHFAETFIVPAEVGRYSIRPFGQSEGRECVTIKAYVQVNNLVNYQID